MRLTLHQEQVSPTGSIMSIGVLNQLGRPKLDSLALLIREALQNTWDARTNDNTPVFFGLRGSTLSDTQRQRLSENIFKELPPNLELPLLSLLASPTAIQALVLYDRGTTGLGGTTRADETPLVGETNDFVNFLRNVGQTSDRAFTGGTYGYGKAAFYRASQVRTVCVYTRCRFRGQLETRFMAAALSEPYAVQQVRYTGRLWWGVQDDSHVIEPILNENADEFAEMLGMPLFRNEECGTDILVLQPYLGEQTPLQAANLMAENILWYFWPKLMVQPNGYPALKVDVDWEGQHLEIPTPETYPPLKGFVEAMDCVRRDASHSDRNLQTDVHRLSTERPKQTLGELTIKEFPKTEKTAIDPEFFGDNGFSHIHHHVALMREPQMIVKYLPGLPLKDPTKGYAGVFVVDRALDSVFASAEPPTHDDWNASSLDERHHRTFVNQALKQIERAMSTFTVAEADEKPTGVNNNSTVSLARRLGNLLNKNYTVAHSTPTTRRQHSIVELPRKTGELYTPDEHLWSSIIKSAQSFGTEKIEPSDLGSLHVQPEAYPLFAPQIVNNVSAVSSKQFNDRVAVIYTAQRLIVTEQGTPAVKVDFLVEHMAGSQGTYVRPDFGVMLDGNTRESAPPVGQEQPTLVYWNDSAGIRYHGSDILFIPSQSSEPCSAVISVPGHVLLRIELHTAVVD